jgi:hypothetical protein
MVSLADLAWYLRRLNCMSPTEIPWRLRDTFMKRLWITRQMWDAAADPAATRLCRTTPPPPCQRIPPSAVSDDARERLLRTAESLMRGEWHVFGCQRNDMASDPDWFFDPITGKRAPQNAYCFSVNYRRGAAGEVKYVWELSRHQHLTILAAAYALTGNQRYAERIATHLQSWWEHNPFLTGINWASGIEVGLRLIAWVWIRRLLSDWPGTRCLFDQNPVFASHLYHHQQYLSQLPSRRSSANNHLLAEMVGLFVATCALPWFAHSGSWRRQAAAALNKEFVKQTFPSGIHRELASGYHAFVIELGFIAALEGDAAGYPLSPATRERLRAMADSTAALVDVSNAPPRQGDCDSGTALSLDGEGFRQWDSLLATAATIFGPCEWWPHVKADDLRTPFLTSLTSRRSRTAGRRPTQRPAHFADAGIVILRAKADTSREIWCRCDGGPHGYLSTAAHAHADALSVEVRYGGLEVLCDPGTYRYYCADKWRDYFRSTLAHNTLELDGAAQSKLGGPFLWMRQAHSRTLAVKLDADELFWEACHDGYRTARHVRRVRMDAVASQIAIEDEIESKGGHACRLAFHLGPAVQASLRGNRAVLSWADAAGQFAWIELPPALSWRAIRGQEDPPLGWFSPSYGQKVPTTTLLGEGRVESGLPLNTLLRFDGGHSAAQDEVCDGAATQDPVGA